MEVETEHKNIWPFFRSPSWVEKGKRKMYDVRLKVKLYQENE